jgi:hypothetical protein
MHLEIDLKDALENTRNLSQNQKNYRIEVRNIKAKVGVDKALIISYI